jgi:hypothetical protein
MSATVSARYHGRIRAEVFAVRNMILLFVIIGSVHALVRLSFGALYGQKRSEFEIHLRSDCCASAGKLGQYTQGGSDHQIGMIAG